MSSDSHPMLDAAFDRIEGTILPTIGATLKTMLDVAEGRAPASDRRAQRAEMRRLAAELEALTREIGRLAPAPAAPRQRADAA